MQITTLQPYWVWQLYGFLATIIIILLIAYITKKTIPKKWLEEAKKVIKKLIESLTPCTETYHFAMGILLALEMLTGQIPKEEGMKKLQEHLKHLKKEEQEAILKLVK